MKKVLAELVRDGDMWQLAAQLDKDCDATADLQAVGSEQEI
jgi:hypothetical protein